HHRHPWVISIEREQILPGFVQPVLPRIAEEVPEGVFHVCAEHDAAVEELLGPLGVLAGVIERDAPLPVARLFPGVNLEVGVEVVERLLDHPELEARCAPVVLGQQEALVQSQGRIEVLDGFGMFPLRGIRLTAKVDCLRAFWIRLNRLLGGYECCGRVSIRQGSAGLADRVVGLTSREQRTHGEQDNSAEERTHRRLREEQTAASYWVAGPGTVTLVCSRVCWTYRPHPLDGAPRDYHQQRTAIRGHRGRHRSRGGRRQVGRSPLHRYPGRRDQVRQQSRPQETVLLSTRW